MAEIKIDIPDILNTFNAELQKEINAAAKKAANDSVKLLKEKSPKKTGEYAAGWTATNNARSITVHNEKHYQLTHLLEKGHRIVGKKSGFVAAKAHITPVEQEMITRYTDEAKKAVERAAGKC